MVFSAVFKQGGRFFYAETLETGGNKSKDESITGIISLFVLI
ncbi:hypothetical protein ADIAL_2031 [Alkalibacterium sp. AK22]|nr:hypothetical protein ADIAL_2031 [Alkalibacterium sp. AK22]